MKKLHTLVIFCESEEITERTLLAINNALATVSHANYVRCTEMDADDVAKALIEKAAREILSEPTKRKVVRYNKTLNDALNIVKEKFANYMHLPNQEPYIYIAAYLHEEKMNTAFKTIANYTMDEVQKCPANSEIHFPEKFIDTIRQIVKELQ